MTLAWFLRKTNQKGNVHHKLKLKYERAKKAAEEAQTELFEDSLEEWANNVKTEGEVALAAMFLSRYNDKYYGQWVLMNVPFRDFDAEMQRPKLALVPDHLYYQTLALLVCPDHWTNPAKIREELELEAFREYHIKNILAMIAANQGLIRQYLDGKLDKNAEVVEAEAEKHGEAPKLAQEQQTVVDEILESLKEGSGNSSFFFAKPLKPSFWRIYNIHCFFFERLGANSGAPDDAKPSFGIRYFFHYIGSSIANSHRQLRRLSQL